jgi:hypothetical protein
MFLGMAYEESLESLDQTRPLVSRALIAVHERRTARLAMLLDGAGLRGLEQLHAYLYAAERAYVDLPAIEKLAILVARVRADFETALEATLSGYQGVASDSMRDVMEIETLLLDFAAHPDNIGEWLQNDPGVRRRKYQPVKVRTRLQEVGIEPFASDDYEPVDYQAHSEALHVSPVGTLTGRGPEPPIDDAFPFVSDLGFIEMFQHGNRILTAIELLRVVSLRRDGQTDYVPLTARDEFDDAYGRTREMQVIVMALVQGPSILTAELGRQPTDAELLRYLAREIETKSPRT